MNLIDISHGMVMQRDAHDRSDTLLCSDTPLTEATYEGPLTGKATLAALPNGHYRLQGIPVGGPYTVTLDGQSYADIYVGDVWLLGGQSNMAGVGHTTLRDCADLGDPTVRAFYMTDRWTRPTIRSMKPVGHSTEFTLPSSAQALRIMRLVSVRGLPLPVAYTS